jgi:toxin ParE1/3/4
MENVPYLFKGHARQDLTDIRKYSIKQWGKSQWGKYDALLFRRIQALANNPRLGVVMDEISQNAYRFPDGDHVFYYLKREKDVVFVGILSHSMAPNKHLLRKNDIVAQL